MVGNTLLPMLCRFLAEGAKVILFKRLWKEPLLHFLLLALVIFAAYGVIGPTGGMRPEGIVVTVPKIKQLGVVFAKTWQRPPNTQELKGLIDDYVKEEIYVREAVALGIDQDDPVIRRRLRQKMEFMYDTGVDTLVPSDAELDAYLKAHTAAFAVDPMTAFQQVFLNPQQHDDRVEKDTAAILTSLLATPVVDPATLGDATLLPSELPLTGKQTIIQTFGEEFAEALDKLPLDQWAGPIRSGYGLHIVRVSKREAGHLPMLGVVRDTVAREWTNAKRKELDDARFNELLKRYPVSIENLSAAGEIR
jgi:hypothetical protein